MLGLVPRVSSERPLERKTITPAQLEILLLMIQGLSSKLIARRLKLSELTVKQQRTSLLERTKSRNACQLGYWAAMNGYCAPLTTFGRSGLVLSMEGKRSELSEHAL